MKGTTSKGIYWVLVECTDPSQEEEFNDWYTNTHLAEFIGTGLFHSAYRYQAATPETPKYLTVYETDADDLTATSARLEEARRGWRASGALHPAAQVVRRSFMRRRQPTHVFAPPTPDRITGLLMVASNVKTPGTEEQFVQWYDTVHLEDIGATGLMKVAHRFEALEPQEGEPRYVNLYETELEEVSRARTGLNDFRQGWIDKGRYYFDREFQVMAAYRLIASYPNDL